MCRRDAMSSSRNRKPLSRGCAMFVAAGFLVAGIAGLIAICIMLVVPMLKLRAWEAVPCTVLRAEVERGIIDFQGNPQFTVKTELAWEYQGVRHTGGKPDADAGFHTAESVNSMEEFCHVLRRQPQRTCYVNPDNPSESILRLPEWWPVILFTALASMFIFVGVVLLRGSRHATGEPGRRTRGRAGAMVALVIGLTCAAGGGAIWWYAIRSATDWSAIAPRMKELPCTIAGSTIKEDRGSGRNRTVTYRPVITFSYVWDGRTWYSEWYNFNRNASGSSKRSDAVEVVQRYPRNTTHSCWMDPEQPWVAVLEKDGSGFQWAWIPAVLLLLLGGLIALAGLRTLSRPRRPPAAVPPPLPE
jgi:hypothetical protein